MIDIEKKSDVSENEDKGVAFVDILIVLAKNKRYIIASILVAAFISTGLSFLLPNEYTARTQILPPQSQSGSSALLGQLGSLGGIAGASMGIKNPNDMYVGVLNSRTIADKIIEQFDLKKSYKSKLIADTRISLAKATNITSDKSGIIIIDVVDEDPKLAAALANAYVIEVKKLMNTLAVTQASQRRLFFQNQLIEAKNELAAAEEKLKIVQEKTGLIQLGDQAVSIIKAIAEIKGKIAAKEVEISAMRSFATTGNPEYIQAQNVLAGLRAQLDKAQTGINNGNGDISVSTSKVPEAGLEYVRRLRDVKYYETVFELLAKQFEMAKIDEAKDNSLLQTLDIADVPEKKSGPKRLFIILGAILFACFFSILRAFIIEGSENKPEKKEKWNLFKKYIKSFK